MAKKLVVYFSASGNTKKLAMKIASLEGADLHEILPQEPYTKEDLNWLNPNSRSSVEMKDKTSRPKIANKVEDISQYDTIYVGFPIWWYVGPTIINTFLEGYDLKDKTIITFATSGGSGMGETVEWLESSCKGAILKEGRVFSSNVGDDELLEWIKKINQ